MWREAQRLVAQAGWRNENSVKDLAGLTQVVEAYEAVNKEFDISGLRWMVHHVPVVNADLLTRLRALGCGVQMAAFRWVTSTDPKVDRRRAVPDDRRSWHPGRHPRRWRSHRAFESLARTSTSRRPA